MIEQALHFTADLGREASAGLWGTENIAERFLVAWPADIAAERARIEAGEFGVFLHLREDSAADDDFSRVCRVCGFRPWPFGREC